MSKRRRSGTSKKVAENKFWGEEPDTGEGDGPHRLTPTPDPSALVRSLGPPPLAVDEREATVHLAAIYGEAVRTATALLAANGLLADPDDEET